MPKILTGRYGSAAAAVAAAADLINAGFEREKVYLNRDTAHVKVMTPTETEREAREILGRHDPAEMFERLA
jgi:hypothetical protein